MRGDRYLRAAVCEERHLNFWAGSVFAMKSGKEGKFKKEIDRVVHDYAHRTFLSSSLSMAATAVFGSYNLYLGFAYHAAWNFGIAVYFLLLCALRGYVLFSERALYKRCPSEEEREEKKKKLYLGVYSIGNQEKS